MTNLYPSLWSCLFYLLLFLLSSSSMLGMIEIVVTTCKEMKLFSRTWRNELICGKSNYIRNQQETWSTPFVSSASVLSGYLSPESDQRESFVFKKKIFHIYGTERVSLTHSHTIKEDLSQLCSVIDLAKTYQIMTSDYRISRFQKWQVLSSNSCNSMFQ